MLSSLKFVQGAVARKDFVPELTHFRIHGGSIRGYNGMLGLCCPIDLDLDVCPRATPFIKAIQTCQDTIQLHLTPGGKLSVKSGKFKALIECTTESFPEVEPEGEVVKPDGALLKTLKKLAPFISEDASRPWSRGILLRGQSAFATNNIVLVEAWLGYTFPVEINIPRAAIVELLRIGEEPEFLQVTKTSVTFHFSGKRWLRTQTFSTEWPDLGWVLDVPPASDRLPIPDKLWDALESLDPFTEDLGKVFLFPGIIATSETKEIGAMVEVPELQATGCYNAKQLSLLKNVADRIDFSAYPGPSSFVGENIRGAIVGMRA